MVKRIFLLPVLLLLCADTVWAQRAVAKEDDRAARRQWEEDQRADEYATSLRRRDWLKDRLILELGAGSKFPTMGASWFGFGAGVEYITEWHVSGFLTGGFIPARSDPQFEEFSLEGGVGWRVGLAYYLFPKNPVHLSVQASYGTVFYDHKSKPDDFDEGGRMRNIILCRGYEFDIAVTYLSDQWYFLQAMVGFYTIGNGLKGGGNSWGRTNDSWELKLVDNEYKYVSLVEVNSDNSDEAIPPYGIVFGIGIGFAFEEFFPDDTEIRRRERENTRSNQNQLRRPATQNRSAPASKRPSRVVEDDDE